MKKKALSLVLALVMCLGLTVPALADGDDAPPEASPEDVSYTITFDADGGKFADGSDTQTIPTHSEGYIQYAPDIPTREGYRFVNWGGMSDDDLKYHKFTSNDTVKATWEKLPEFYITLDPNGGAVSPGSIKLTADGKLTASLPTPTRPGYQFEGWWLGEWNVTDDNAMFTGPGTLTAKWTKPGMTEQEPVRVDFLPNGGRITEIFGKKVPALSAGQPPFTVNENTGIDQNSGIAWTYTDEYGQVPGLPAAEREGYAFDGWYAVSGVAANQAWDGALTDFSGLERVTSAKFTQSTELAAKWIKADSCTVTFYINTMGQLDNPKPLTLKKGEELELPNDPNWEGYTFLGWYSGTVVKNELKDPIQWEDGDKVTEDVTLYALWQKKDGGSSAVQPETPVIEVENIPSSGTAMASTQTVTVDGKAVEFQMYALLNADGNPTNYIKLRDMAYILNGTKAQFAVGYDGTISLTTGQAYAAGGTEMTTPFSGNRAYAGGAQTVKVNGEDVAMTAITLTDDNGGGYNYFKLRDLGSVLGFTVGYSNETGISITTAAEQ